MSYSVKLEYTYDMSPTFKAQESDPSQKCQFPGTNYTILRLAISWQ